MRKGSCDLSRLSMAVAMVMIRRCPRNRRDGAGLGKWIPLGYVVSFYRNPITTWQLESSAMLLFSRYGVTGGKGELRQLCCGFTLYVGLLSGGNI